MTPLRHLLVGLEDPRIINAHTTTSQIELLQLLIRRICQHIRDNVCIISLNWLSFLEWRLICNLQTISSKHFIPVHLVCFQGFSLRLDCLSLIFCVASCIIGLLDQLCHIFRHNFYHITLIHDLHHIFLFWRIHLLLIHKLIQIGVYVLLVRTQTSLPLCRHNSIWLVIISIVWNRWRHFRHNILVSSLFSTFL